jgi:hypothetical protein
MWALLCRTPMTLFSMDGPQGGSGFPRRAVKALQGWSYPACHALYLSLVLHFLSVSTKLLLFGIRLVVCQILETRSVPDFGDLFLIVGYLCGPHWLGIPNANIQSLKYYRIWIFWVSHWCSPGLAFGALQILDLCSRDAQPFSFTPPTLGHRASPLFLPLSLFSIANF